jgi:hypothetical protein
MALFKKKQDDLPRRRQASLSGAIRPEASFDEASNVFRRNRTLTGSTSQHISPIQAKADLESPRTQAHNLAIRRRKITGTLIVVLLVGAFLTWLISEYTAKPTIVVSDTAISTVIDKMRYEKAIQDYLDANPIGRLRFGLDQDSMSQYVSRTLPEVASVQQEGLSGFATSDFLVTMRQPVAGWKIGTSQYYVDSSGVPFQINYFGTPAVEIDDESGVGVIEGSGTAIVSNSFLGFVGKVVSAASNSGYDVTNAIIPVGTTRQLEIRLKGYSFLVKLSIDRGPAEQIEDMGRAIKYLVSKSITPQYIDVRVSGRAYYL